MNRAALLSASGPVLPAQSPSACEHVWVADKVAGQYMTRCMKCQLQKQVEIRAPEGDAGALKRIEHRLVGAGLTELVLDANDDRSFQGYGCVYGPLDSYRCIWEPGVFAASLSAWRSKNDWPSFYLQHDWDLLIGEWTDMYEDNKGLVVKGRFINSAWGDHGRALVKEKIAKGLSVGFIAIDEFRENEDDWTKMVRHITKADLYEVSLVERNAVPGSEVDETSLRSLFRVDMSAVEVRAVLVEKLGVDPATADRMAATFTPAETEAEAAAKAAAAIAARNARVNHGLAGELRNATINQTLIQALQNAGANLRRK